MAPQALLEDFDLDRLHKQMAAITKDRAAAEDMVSEAIVQTLEKGEPLVGGRVFSFAKILWLRDRQRGQGRISATDPFLLASMLEREDESETHLVSHDRCRIKRPNRGGGRPRAEGHVTQAPCDWCGKSFQPRKTSRGTWTQTCSMSCGAKRRHDRNRQAKERGTHIARSN